MHISYLMPLSRFIPTKSTTERNSLMKSISKTLTLLLLAGCAVLVPARAARAEFLGSAISIQIWTGGANLGQYELNVAIPSDPWGWELSAPLEIYSADNSGHLLATIDSLGIYLDGDPAVNLSFAVTAGATPTLISVASSTVVFAPLNGADAFATAALSITDGNGNGATAVGTYPGNKAYQANYNGGSVFAQLVSPVVAGVNSSATGTERDPLTGTLLIPGVTSSIQSRFSFVLSAFDSASGTSRFQVNIPGNNIPEPSTWLLASMAAVGGLWMRHRRSRR